MSRNAALEIIRHTGVVAVVRITSREAAHPVACALRDGGVTAIEMTMTLPGALEVIGDLHARMGGEITLGAGTVLDADTASRAVSAGARFVVSPGLDGDVIRACHAGSAAAIPGALTPSEVIKAHRSGADIVKVFPCANVGGPRYLAALRAPLPDIPLMPTGGVDLSNVGDFIRAGAVAVAAGSSLIDTKAVAERNWERISSGAAAFVDAVKKARSDRGG